MILQKLRDLTRVIRNNERINKQELINCSYILRNHNAQLEFGPYDRKFRNFRVYSQWNEDSILSWLFDVEIITNKRFVEVGVEDFQEANLRYLVDADNFSGVVIDCDVDKLNTIRKSNIMWQQDIEVIEAFVGKYNAISSIPERFRNNIGILSIDIDSVDYHVLSELIEIQPQVVICEINNIFGLRPISVPYSDRFDRMKMHFSGQYYGASCIAFNILLSKNGYSFFAFNDKFSNAIFIRNDLINSSVFRHDIKREWQITTLKEGRLPNGKLSYVDQTAAFELIKDLPYEIIDS